MADGYSSVNESLLRQCGFPCSIEAHEVELSVQDPEILRRSMWYRRVAPVVRPEPLMYLRPTVDEHEDPSFWIEINSELSGTTNIWAFRAFRKRGQPPTIKLSILQVEVVVTGGKVELLGGLEWTSQTFNASPAGFTPVEAIMTNQGEGRGRFLALVMQSTLHKKTLMHCHRLPLNLCTGPLSPRWN